ncbi:hypothetical protein GCM10010523_12690 [Paenarthrobacter ilicis]
MNTATSRNMKRRLNLELVSLGVEVSTAAVVPGGLVIEMCSLPDSAHLADGLRASGHEAQVPAGDYHNVTYDSYIREL